MDDDFVKKRLERDLGDLKRMCDEHFKKRADDDSHITSLEGRITERQDTREAQKQERQDKEQAKVSRLLLCMFIAKQSRIKRIIHHTLNLRSKPKRKRRKPKRPPIPSAKLRKLKPRPKSFQVSFSSVLVTEKKRRQKCDKSNVRDENRTRRSLTTH